MVRETARIQVERHPGWHTAISIKGKVQVTDMLRQVDAELDASGLFCPEPVMMLHTKVRELSAGAVLKVIATDPSTQRDIPKFCMFLEHQLLDSSEDAGTYVYWIRKKL